VDMLMHVEGLRLLWVVLYGDASEQNAEVLSTTPLTYITQLM